MKEMEKILTRANEGVVKLKNAPIPKYLWNTCKGFVLINFYETGFVFSLNDGDGIVVKKNDDGTWSAPSALKYEGVGAGAIFGKGNKTLIIFPLDNYSLNMFTAETKWQFGAQVGAAAGKWGSEVDANVDAGGHGAGVSAAVGAGADLSGMVYYVLSGGILLDVGIQDNFIHTADKINVEFYGKHVPANDIINKPGAVKVPACPALDTFLKNLPTGA
jgi:lipid-binding SYLF domain-containing protein